MNILRVTPTFPPRVCGWSAHTWGLSRQQAAQGHHVDVLQPIAPASADGRMHVHRVSRPNFRHGVRRHLSDLVFDLRATATIARSAHRRADVVHAHGDAIEAGVFGLLGRWLNVPVVLTVHSSLNARSRYALIAKRAFPLVSGFIAVSGRARTDLIRLGVPADRVVEISSGVDLERFSLPQGVREEYRQGMGIVRGEIVVTFIGRLQPVKGVGTLIDAARLLPPGKFRVLIGGDGPRREVLAREAASLPHVSLLGELSRADVARVLHASDVFVMPSVDVAGHSEGTPTAVIEAMASALPIVSSDSGGLPGIVEHDENGLIFPQRNAAELARLVTLLGRDDERRLAIGRNNRREAERRAWPNVARSVVEFYERVGARSHGQETRCVGVAVPAER